MPTYDYKCPKCHRTKELFHKMEETYLVSCPECNVCMLKRISAGIGVRFKGTGFYETDYKGK